MKHDTVAELIANLAERPLSLERSTAIPKVPPEIIAHAMGLISHPQQRAISCLLRVKYARQEEFYNELEIKLYIAIAGLATEKDWRVPKQYHGKEFYRRIGKMALKYCLEPHTCSHCGGWGQDIQDGKVITCPTCNGTQREFPSMRLRARTMHVDHKTWIRTWEGKYQDILSILDRWERVGLGAMNWKMTHTDHQNGIMDYEGEGKVLTEKDTHKILANSHVEHFSILRPELPRICIYEGCHREVPDGRFLCEQHGSYADD